jgi:hypothetical protein
MKYVSGVAISRGMAISQAGQFAVYAPVHGQGSARRASTDTPSIPTPRTWRCGNMPKQISSTRWLPAFPGGMVLSQSRSMADGEHHGGDAVSVQAVDLSTDRGHRGLGGGFPVRHSMGGQVMVETRYCRECQRETRHRRSEPDGIPYPRDWAWIVLALPIWLVNQVLDVALSRWRCIECGKRRNY